MKKVKAAKINGLEVFKGKSKKYYSNFGLLAQVSEENLHVPKYVA